jgi:hypothetical protein
MWQWILVIVIPLFILAILEEIKEFFVNRYVLGPAVWEGKVKRAAWKSIQWLKKKLKRETTAN